MVPGPGSIVDGPCTSTVKWGILYCASDCFISAHLKSFLFFFKGNQERAIDEIVEIKGICCLKKYSLISEMEVLYNYE